MKITMLILTILTIGCSTTSETTASRLPKEDQNTQPVYVPIFRKQNVPTSQRSRDVVSQVAPSLIRALNAKGLEYGSPIFIRIFKEELKLEVWLEKEETFHLFRTYDIAAMSGHLGPKMEEGDHQAPEGFYFVKPARMNPNSRFHLSFNIGYPNKYDRTHHRTGSALMVHGNRVSIGCFAMTDAKIEEIYTLAEAALRNGQKFFRVHSFPFRMSEENMVLNQNSRHAAFWKNVKTGYDFFENKKRPPNVRVRQKRYTFN